MNSEKIQEIFQKFHGKLIGSFPMKMHICEVVARMPDDMIDFVTTKCWFMGSMDDAWAFAFTGNDLKDQHLIFLSDSLMREHHPQIFYSIAHEIGHVVLNHRNSVLVKQSKEEIEKQEQEADEFAYKYVPEFKQ